MSLIKWEPFNGFDRYFDQRFLSSLTRPDWDLAVDVYEEKGDIVTKMSLPNVRIEDIDVTFDDNILTITGKREDEEETDKKDFYSKEIRRGSFSRSVRLPKSVDGKKAEAVYKDGTLKVTAPVVSGAEDKSIKIKVK